MVLKEEQFARYQDLVPIDADHELIRLARAGNTQFNEELRLLEEDDIIDENYKVIFFCLLTIDGRLDPRKKKNDKEDVQRSEALKKRKNIKDASKHDDDCNVEEENDPHYELFLKHLKQHHKSYVLEYEKDGLPVVIKYEGDIDSDKEGDPKPGPRRKLNRAHNAVNEKIPKEQDAKSTSVKKTNNADKVENAVGLSTDIMLVRGDTPSLRVYTRRGKQGSSKLAN